MIYWFDWEQNDWLLTFSCWFSQKKKTVMEHCQGMHSANALARMYKISFWRGSNGAVEWNTPRGGKSMGAHIHLKKLYHLVYWWYGAMSVCEELLHLWWTVGLVQWWRMWHAETSPTARKQRAIPVTPPHAPQPNRKLHHRQPSLPATFLGYRTPSLRDRR